MNNNTKINLIDEIVLPYFKLEMDEFYPDPKLLYFKKKSRDEKYNKISSLSKKDEKIMIEKIKNLNIGKVEIISYTGIGIFMQIDMNVTDEEEHRFKYF